MTSEKVRKLNILSRQLSENLMSASLCVKEINEIAQTEVGNDDTNRAEANGYGHTISKVVKRPLLDEATLSVTWGGRTLHLGHTQGFWLLVRLARRANQYVTHLDLLQEIWDDDFADTGALRAGVRRLRAKLREGGMGDLADAIAGHRGRYILDLADVSRHRKVMAVSHRTSQS